MPMSELRIGYFESFKGADTILVCGDDDGLQRLADHLRTHENATAEIPVPPVRGLAGTLNNMVSLNQ